MRKYLLLSIILLVSSSCASAPKVSFPATTRVLGIATIYQSATGERLEVIHDNRAGVAILKLPDGTVVVLPAELVGSEERYKDARMTVWEHDSGVQLWIDGNVAFSGTIHK
jgi:membrane-bound inhibitor of C-type lysozyme